jgi:hypothetical protein
MTFLIELVKENGNPGILKKRNCSPVRRGQVIGGISGAILTLVIHGLCLLLGKGGESSLAWALGGPWFAILIPTYAFYRLFGLPWHVGSVFDVSLGVFCSMLILNSILLALIGGGVGYVVKKSKQKRSYESSDELP